MWQIDWDIPLAEYCRCYTHGRNERERDRSKYILELKDDVQVVQKVGVTENGNAFVMNFYKDQLEELTADYINEHFGGLQDTAYQKGLENGKQATFALVADASNAEYQKGLNDAWECARKLFSSMADSDIEKAFPIEWNNGGFKALMNLQPQEAIAKLKAYEDSKKADSIEVGDEVRTRDGVPNPSNTFLVTKVIDSHVYGISNDGSWNYYTEDGVKKTGKHYDIASILEAMRTHD